MAIKYNNSNNLREITFGEDDVKYVKFKNGNEDEMLVWAKPFTLTLKSTQWTYIKKVDVKVITRKEPTSSDKTFEYPNANFDTTIYYGEALKIIVTTKDGYHFGETEATDNSANYNTTQEYTLSNISDNVEINIATIQLNKNLITIDKVEYNRTSHKGHISSCWLDTNSQSTSGITTSKYYNYDTTVYGFVKLRDDGAKKIPDGWQLISGSVGKKDAIYRVGSTKVKAYDGYNFGTIELETNSYTLTFSSSGYTSWNSTSSVSVYWGDIISKSDNTLTISKGDYNSFNSVTRTYSFLYNEPTKYYYYNNTLSPSTIPSSITESIAFKVSNERKEKIIRINITTGGNKCLINLNNTPSNWISSKDIIAGTTWYLYFMFNNNYYNDTRNTVSASINGTNQNFTYTNSDRTYNSRTWRVYRLTFSNYVSSSENIEIESVNYSFNGTTNLLVRQIDDFFSFDCYVEYDEESGSTTTRQTLRNLSDYSLETTLRTRENSSSQIFERTETIYPRDYVEAGGNFGSGYYWVKFKNIDDVYYIKPWQNSNTGGGGTSFHSQGYWIIYSDTGIAF